MSLELRCPRHPDYDGIDRPGVPCRDCWELFRLKHDREAG